MVTPGDHIIMKVWIKTDGTYIADYTGARLNLDWYGANGRIGDGYTGYNILNSNMVGATFDGYVHWGSDWTQVIFDFIVPSYAVADGWEGNPNYYLGQNVVPTFIIPWCQIWCYPGYPEDAYDAWFSGMEIYKNPTIESTPTPDPSATPTPTPTSSPVPTAIPPIFPHPEITPTPSPTPTPFVSTAQAATNQVFTNVYLALGIAVVSTLIAGCYIIIAAFNSGNGNARFGVGLVIVSIIEVVIGVVVVSAFQGSMGTVAINLLSIKGITLVASWLIGVL
jgi:hypothetical protein